MKYLYSVIIPVFNSEKTIRRCLNSILDHRHSCVEIIVVNDGSTDRSNEIIQEFANNHSDFIYLQKENGGVSSARNAGLDVAHGEYVLFVDSDDYVLPTFFDTIDRILSEYPVDFIAHSVQSWKEDFTYSSNPTEIPRLISKLEYLGNLAQSPQKVFSRSLIEALHLRFCENLVIGEDIVFIFTYVLNAKKIAITSEHLYQIVLDNSESLSRKRRTYLCEQSLLMRAQMWASLNGTNLSPSVFAIYYKMFCWSFYHGAYSVCKELLKFNLPLKRTIKEINNICDRFNNVNIVPRNFKSFVLAFPIRHRLSWIIYLMVLMADKYRNKGH